MTAPKLYCGECNASLDRGHARGCRQLYPPYSDPAPVTARPAPEDSRVEKVMTAPFEDRCQLPVNNVCRCCKPRGHEGVCGCVYEPRPVAGDPS